MILLIKYAEYPIFYGRQWFIVNFFMFCYQVLSCVASFIHFIPRQIFGTKIFDRDFGGWGMGSVESTTTKESQIFLH